MIETTSYFRNGKWTKRDIEVSKYDLLQSYSLMGFSRDDCERDFGLIQRGVVVIRPITGFTRSVISRNVIGIAWSD